MVVSLCNGRNGSDDGDVRMTSNRKHVLQQQHPQQHEQHFTPLQHTRNDDEDDDIGDGAGSHQQSRGKAMSLEAVSPADVQAYKTTIDTSGFESRAMLDSPEPSTTTILAHRLETLTVFPPVGSLQRQRDATPPAARPRHLMDHDNFTATTTNSDDAIMLPRPAGRGRQPFHVSPGSGTLTTTQQPQQHTPHRETPPKCRSPAFMLRPMPRPCDLTPVTRNTSSNGDALWDDYSDDDGAATGHCLITPEDSSGLLHGERLALPSDLSPEVSFQLATAPGSQLLPERRTVVPSLPPLRGCKHKQRTKSVGTLDTFIQTACHQMKILEQEEAAATTSCTSTHLEHEEMWSDMLQPPIEFPERQVFSFTSRKQYEQQKRKNEDPEMFFSSSALERHGLTPYQPSREELKEDVGALPEEELSRIFIDRKRTAATTMTTSHVPFGDVLSSSSESNLGISIPLEERQWSIPSLRMAHHLNGSTTSNTDEEDDLRGEEDEDDASLSSRGSSLYLPDDAALTGSEAWHRRSVPLLAASFQPIFSGPVVNRTPVMEDELRRHIDDDEEEEEEELLCHYMDGVQPHKDDEEGASSNDAVDGRVHGRKKRSKKDQRAIEWLRTVEASHGELAEAASSRFLTGGSFTLRNNMAAAATLTASSSPSLRVRKSVEGAVSL